LPYAIGCVKLSFAMQASVNIEVTKGPNENNLSVLRRFTKRVQAAGVLPRVRSKRYTERTPSVNTRRTKTIAYLKKKEKIATLLKEGKLSELSSLTRRKR
jgi:ribosomal protein S21